MAAPPEHPHAGPAPARQGGSGPSPASSSSQAPRVILVTGGTGLVGRAVAKFVQHGAGAAEAQAAGERWVFASSADGDLRDRAATFALWEAHRPAMVLHLAAFVGGLYRNMRSKVEFFR